MKRNRANNRGTRVHLIQDDKYWARLQRDFWRCSYQHGGAYSTIEAELGSANVQELRARIRTNEARYNNFNRKSEEPRLARASAYRPTKKTLDQSR